MSQTYSHPFYIDFYHFYIIHSGSKTSFEYLVSFVLFHFCLFYIFPFVSVLYSLFCSILRSNAIQYPVLVVIMKIVKKYDGEGKKAAKNAGFRTLYCHVQQALVLISLQYFDFFSHCFNRFFCLFLFFFFVPFCYFVCVQFFTLNFFFNQRQCQMSYTIQFKYNFFPYLHL